MIEEVEIVNFENLVEGWPILADLRGRHVFINNELIKKVEGTLQKYKRCLIRGAEGRGKTVLARVVAYNKYNKDWDIWFVDVREAIEERSSNIFQQINYVVEGEKTLLIVENAHCSLDEITPQLVEFANKHSEVSFIFTSRREEEQFSDPFEGWEEKGWCVDLKPGLKEACRIIETFISAEKINYSLTEQDESWIEKEFGKEEINLRRLKWYLDTWKKEGGSLPSIKKSEVLKEVLKYYRSELGGDVNLEEMLYMIAGIFQFDVDFYGGGYDKAILRKLEKTIIITSRGGDWHGDYYRLKHSIDAVYIIEALANSIKNTNPEDITIDILKEYLQNKPVNYYELMGALHQSKKNHVLLEIFGNQEIYEIIFDMIKQDRIKKMIHILGYLNYACGKERGLKFWVRYKKLGGDSQEEQKKGFKAKLTEAPLSEICSLLSILNKVDVNEEDWLENEVLDDDVLSQKAKDAPFSSIANLARKLSNKKGLAFISKSNPEVMAEEAKSSNVQHIMWFLKYCLRDPSNINFANSFLLALNKKGELIEKLKDTELSTVLEYIKVIKHINLYLSKELKSRLLPYWLQIWLSSSLSTITNQLYRYRWSTGASRKFSQLVVKNLPINLSERIRKLYSQPDTKPLKVLGKLLNYIHPIAFKTDKDAVEKIAQQIVNNIDLNMQKRCTIEQLYLLIKNVKKCNELAWTQLCSRILSELNLNDYINIPFDKGLAFLVWDIYQFNKEKGQELANKILSLDFNKLFDNSETKAISALLWNLLQIDESKAKSWIQNTGDDKWVSKALLSSTEDALQLLWSLYHADEEKGKKVARSFANKMLPNFNAVEVQDTPFLLGFFAFCGIPFDPNISIPSPYEMAEKISEDLSFTKVAFYICLLKKKNNKLLEKFLKELDKQLFLKNIEFPVKEIIEKHPFENTRKVLREIFKDFDQRGALLPEKSG